MTCDHKGEFNIEGKIHFIEDKGTRMFDVKLNCGKCNMPFMFKGVPIGLNMDGAAVSPLGTELRIKVVPADEEEAPIIHELEQRGPAN